MDWNRIEGSWKQTAGKIKEKWGKLTDDDLAQINGKREQFEGKIQERYGIAKDQVRKDVDTWLNSMDRPCLARSAYDSPLGDFDAQKGKAVGHPFSRHPQGYLLRGKENSCHS